MTDLFSNPGTGTSDGEKLPLADLLGALLIVTVHKETDEIQTEYGPTTAISADVAVLDGDHKGDTYPDTLIFPRVLKSQLRGSAGGKVLGRLGQGEKKPGKNPPWRLNDPTDADRETAKKYLAYVATQAPVEAPAQEEAW